MHKSGKLKFPVIKGKLPSAKHLSMDDYLKFVNLNLKYTVDIKAVRKQKRAQAVNTPFFLK
jgi:hypothetical protein